ncbi:HlyD family type I secretion periplasmic adaptor subunit [Tropicimonas sp. TH_r6]|uniref:HlyD family type I secretion periplasmic adaptor subunit n=1 Tax=Tropicimonas sp. TH_r6 TaxID=3082085 RepID=UPI002954F1F2|nr:HlyD family type I secretion periplasmic adaptor subunit [Tropicimonas sp. TH_r6]MDV7144123.1 HlyD family type I secretion periplasmic adaptor subunit [Tropicimonas sp. TH_r6]
MTTPSLPSARVPLCLGGIALFLLVFGIGSWAAMTRISGAIVSTGQVEVDQNRQVVQHLEGGIVDQVLVEEGDSVLAGQRLVVLDSSALRTELAIVESQLHEVHARVGRLRAERDSADRVTFPVDLLATAEARAEVADLVEGQRRLFDARLRSLFNASEQLARRSEQIGSQIEGIDAQGRAYREQLSLIDKELEDQQKLLDKGLAQASRVLSLQRERAQLSGALGELAASRAETLGRRTEIDIEIQKLSSARREEAIRELRDQQHKLIELVEERLSLREQLARQDITAPTSGIVYGMSVNTPRSVVRAAEPVAYIVPQDRPLVIATKIEPIHVDQIHTGQEVILRFPVFDSRTTPELLGHVSKVSADAFTDERTALTYYRAEIALDEGEVESLGSGKEVLPGMPVEAYIRTGERTPLAYLLKPFTDYFNKAFREI